MGAVALFAALAVLLVGGGLRLRRTEQRLRSARMAEASRRLGLDFHERGTVAELKELGDLEILGRGDRREVRNVMLGRFGGRQVAFFDYTYIEDAGEDAWTYRQSVALFPGTRLPDFDLEPKGTIGRLASALGVGSVAVEGDPAFSSGYSLTGPDQTAVRASFGPAALAFFATERHWRVEVRGGTAAVWCHDRRCKPEEAEVCLAELVEVIDTLSPA